MQELKYHINNRAHLKTLIAAERKKGSSEEVIRYLWQKGLDYLAQRRSDNARRKYIEGLWNKHIIPLQTERKRVVASLAYKNYNRNNSDARQMALKAYRKVLDELLRRMQREATCVPFDDRPTMLPVEYIKAKNIPNNGEHWTDFVPIHIKRRVVALFDEIPYRPKAKRKIPFERVVGIELHELQKERLIRRTEKELVKCKQDALLNPKEAELLQDRIQKIEQALDNIEQMDPNEPVPTSWHGMYR